jgi:hypothetical protein
VPEARALVSLALNESELGQFTLDGTSGFFISSESRQSGVRMMSQSSGGGPSPVGLNPSVRRPDNGAVNRRLAADPALRVRVSLAPKPSVRRIQDRDPAAGPDGSSRHTVEPKVTSAEVLEALHHATAMPIVADYYTRLHKPESVTAKNQPLFGALNRVADAMRLRWTKDGSWLQFRSASYYHDRLKEVPNRLLFRWVGARRPDSVLPLEHLTEMGQLSDAHLDASEVAEGIRERFGLVEWDVARKRFTRSSLRFLGQLTPAQRAEVVSPKGLPFPRMTLAQQRRFAATLIDQTGLRSFEELTGAGLRVVYSVPGRYQWAVPVEPGSFNVLSPVEEPTRGAALQAARRLNPEVQPAEIIPTELALTFVYTWGSPGTGSHAFHARATPTGSQGW